MANKKPKWENGQQKQKMLSLISQLVPMGTETAWSRILKNILHQAASCSTSIIRSSRMWFFRTGMKARLQNHCAHMVLHWKMHLMHHLHQEHASQHVRTLESQPRSIVINFTCKDTVATWISVLPVENVELWTLHLCYKLVWYSHTAISTKYAKFCIFHVTVIVIDYC